MGLDALISSPFTGNAVELAGKYKGRLLIIIAGGACVWEDFRNFTHGNWHSDWDVMAVNDAGIYFDRPLEHWYSNHWDYLHAWKAVRDLHYEPAKHLHSNFDGHQAVTFWPVPGMGTSSLCACYVGLCLGYDQIILCGVPLDNGPNFFDPVWRVRNFVNEGREDIWLGARDRVFDGRVKSMSGRTREWLGAP